MKKQITSEDDFIKATAQRSKKLMLEYGFGLWDEPDEYNEQLLLIPGYALKYIPRNIKLQTIANTVMKFNPDKMPYGTREGYLAYGIICKADS